MSNLAVRLDALLAAYRAQGLDPSGNLKPGLSDEEIDALASPLGLAIPEPVRELYRWRNGVVDPGADFNELFVFRDQPFLSLDDAAGALVHVRAMVDSTEFGVETALKGVGLVPIAAFEGFFYVVPAGDGLVGLPTTHPVICLGEGEDVHYLSVATMIETCIEWIADPSLDKEDLSVEDDEAAWERHNPGVFDIELG